MQRSHKNREKKCFFQSENSMVYLYTVRGVKAAMNSKVRVSRAEVLLPTHLEHVHLDVHLLATEGDRAHILRLQQCTEGALGYLQAGT